MIRRGVLRGLAQPSKSQGEVGALRGHCGEESLDERKVAVPLRREAKLAPKSVVVCGLEARTKAGKSLLSISNRRLLITVEQRKECFRKPRQVPERDAGWLAYA